MAHVSTLSTVLQAIQAAHQTHQSPTMAAPILWKESTSQLEFPKSSVILQVTGITGSHRLTNTGYSQQKIRQKSKSKDENFLELSKEAEWYCCSS